MEMLVEALVSALTERVGRAIENEAWIAVKLKSELGQMKKSLGRLEDLVREADTKLPHDAETINIKKFFIDRRGWLYDVDNALTDFRIRDMKKGKNRFSSCLLSLDPVFPLVMGRKLMKINSDMQDYTPVLHNLKYLSGSAAAGCDNASDSSMSQHINRSSRQFVGPQDFSPHKKYGLDEDIKKLRGWILDGNNKDMTYIGIVGMGGLGKTTLAQQLFNDSQILDHFEKTMWVCVSGNCSEPWIVKKLLENVREGTPPTDSHDVLAELNKVLKGRSYLIVLDDVWPCKDNPFLLKNLCCKLPTLVGKSSWTIITTRNEDLAKNIVLHNTQIHYPKPLKNDDSWNLFSEFAFRHGEHPSEQLKLDSEHILKKCGGLPLAIKTLGSLLCNKVYPSEWKNTSDKFHALTTEGKTVDVIKSLQLSYDELPHTKLKQCLLCVSIYPEDFEIDAEQLIHWWVGEDLVQQKGLKTAIELGYEYLAELVNRCLLEAVERRGYDGRVYKCKIHDMVREVIIKIAAEEAFCSFNEQGKLMQKDEQRWLCFSDDKNELKNNPKLRTFFLMSSPPNKFFKNFGSLESLRVLNLSKVEKVVKGSTTRPPVMCIEDLFRCISSLKRLACLNLSGIQSLRQVPSSIQKLLNLQLLVLKGCINLVKIHPSIKCLKRLIVLDLGDCPLDLPQCLGSLCFLQELTGFKVRNLAKTQGCTIQVLRELTDLRVLEIVLCVGTEISTAEGRILSSLKNLKVLTIDGKKLKEMNTLRMLDMLKMPPILELYVRNYCSVKMPNWFNPSDLSSLQYLCVEKCDIERLPIDESIWKTVEGLCLKSLKSCVEDWKSLSEIMPVLRYMEISNCSELKNFPVDKRGVWTMQRRSVYSDQ